MEKNLIGLILTVIGLIIIFVTFYLNKTNPIFGETPTVICWTMLLLGIIIVLIGTFIMAGDLKVENKDN